MPAALLKTYILILDHPSHPVQDNDPSHEQDHKETPQNACLASLLTVFS